MKFSVCLLLLVAVWQASAQAPGDESSTCVNQRQPYPPNISMLIDSQNYEQLITGSGAVWQALDVDGTGNGWRSSFGGLCAAQPRSCDFREGTPQDNWFLTQYINYINATEIFVNITANFQECRLNSACTQLYVDMYHYERNGVDATAARNTTNYQLVRRIEQPSDFSQQQYMTSFSFTPSGNTNGFYLGFRDTGTCVSIPRLQVYYSTLPQMPDATTPPPTLPTLTTPTTPPPTLPTLTPPTTPPPTLPTLTTPTAPPPTLPTLTPPALPTLTPPASTIPTPTPTPSTTPAATTPPLTGVTIDVAVGIAVAVTGTITFIVGVLVGIVVCQCKHRSKFKPKSSSCQQHQTDKENEEVHATELRNLGT